MKDGLSERSKDIETVIRERDRLMLECRLLNTDLAEKKDATIIQNHLIRISGILSNIGGFCDKNSREKINQVLVHFSVAMINNEIDRLTSTVKMFLPLISGLVVNFKKRPFRFIGFNFHDAGIKFERE